MKNNFELGIEKTTSNEYEAEAELEAIKSDLEALEQLRRDYYEDMKNAPVEEIEQELQTLEEEIAEFQTEQNAIAQEILDLKGFKFMLLDVLRKRENENQEKSEDSWTPIYDSIRKERGM